MSRFERDVPYAVPPRRTSELGAEGVAPHVLRTARWERTSRGLYLPAGASRTTAQRILAAAALVPPDAALAGWAAGHVHGADLLDGRDRSLAELPVDVLLPGDLHRLPVPGIRYRRASLQAHEVCVVDGLVVTSPTRTGADLACWAPSTVEATVALDLMLALGVVPAALEAAVGRGRRGAVQARQALAAARPGARSPGETRLRLLYLEVAGTVPVRLNPTLLDVTGRVVAVPDLFDEEAGLALEYDGARWDDVRAEGHLDAEQHREDNAREEDVEHLGALVVRAGAADLGPHRRQTAYRLRRARADGLARDRGRDRWILRPGAHERPAPDRER